MTIIIAAIGLLVSLALAAICYQQHQRQQQQISLISDLQNQLAALSSGTVQTDERLIAFERAIAKLREQQGNLSSTVAPQHNYDHAIRLAKKGAASSQLIDSCNLSDEEAHLIARLHGEDHIH